MSELDDLAALIGPSPGEDIRLVQGVIKSWNPNTFENEVDVDGVIRRNLRVGSGIEALTYQPGDVVLVEQWFPGGRKGELGVGTSWIVGRILTPGTGAAEQAIAFMRTALAAQIARGVFGEGIHVAQVNDIETLTEANGEWQDLDTVGPRVTGVEVGDTGRALVEFGATMSSDTPLDNVALSFEVRDASNNVVLPPHGERACQLTFVQPIVATLTRTVLAELPGAGSYTFTLKYTNSFQNATAQFGHRHLIVTPY
jgi:hypothetical protein